MTASDIFKTNCRGNCFAWVKSQLAGVSKDPQRNVSLKCGCIVYRLPIRQREWKRLIQPATFYLHHQHKNQREHVYKWSYTQNSLVVTRKTSKWKTDCGHLTILGGWHALDIGIGWIIFHSRVQRVPIHHVQEYVRGLDLTCLFPDMLFSPGGAVQNYTDLARARLVLALKSTENSGDIRNQCIINSRQSRHNRSLPRILDKTSTGHGRLIWDVWA